ncbi:hypothetical protein NDU88_005054 [Pleurodeles waltl]|uniref:Uncharacterized protein n=1 Tax=Pleurodeles waltl TaxID=8319 RepID=A0AAV7PHF2_PLEWA|nr:hypothetical protein NDU88_005054 [Pleurodeles waltl]
MDSVWYANALLTVVYKLCTGLRLFLSAHPLSSGVKRRLHTGDGGWSPDPSCSTCHAKGFPVTSCDRSSAAALFRPIPARAALWGVACYPAYAGTPE